MPPVRWQFFIALALFSIFSTLEITASHDLPLAANGWRPIIGANYEKRGPQLPPNVPTASKSEPKVVENAINTQQSNKQPNRNKNVPSSGINHHHRPENMQNIRNKEPLKSQGSHSSYVKTSPAHIRVNHHGSTGHHSKQQIPSKQIHKPASQLHMPNKAHGRYPPSQMNKGHLSMANPPQMGKGSSGKRPPNKGKQPPARNQATAHSQRDEIIAQAPSSAIGSYAYFNQGPFNIRDTQLGDRTKTYHHNDFRNHYNLQTSNSDLLPHIQPHYTFAKHPSQNELHAAGQHFNQYYNQNDEFTRNLVPPPPGKTLAEKEIKDASEKQSLITNSKHFLLGKPRDEIRQHYPDNVVLQLPNFSYEDRPINLEITKERLREYHTTLAPPLFSKGTTEGYSTLKYTNKPLHYNHGYEVTEDKTWHDNSPYYQTFSRPATPIRHQTYPTIIPDYRETTQFLPTPFIESVFPTVPTQSEVSTIYSEIAKLNRQNPYQTRYNIKEVATHFPIYDTKPTDPQVDVPINIKPQEVTTKKYIEPTTETYIPQTQEPVKITTKAPRSRQNIRRRRPTKPTTTETYEFETERYIATSEKPQRRRRPIKYRTTESTNDNEATTRGLRRKPKPQVVEEQENYPPNFPVQQEMTENYPQVTQQEEKKLESVLSYKIENEPTTEYPKPTALQFSEEPEVESTTITKRKRIRTTTEEPQQFTMFNVPENELDYTTQSTYTQEPTTEEVIIPEVTTVQATTSTTSTTTTTTEPTTKANRLRRPSKYDTHRPRFSVKDYKQRLTQYVSTTTETPRLSTSAGTLGRIKYPSRFTKQPDSKEDDTEMLRFRFKPKEPRHRTSSTEQYNIEQQPTTEKYKANRIRPFGRIRTTESTSTTQTPKISIKPNIFSNLKRPQSISLRTRILNKNKNKTEVVTEDTNIEKAEVTIPITDNDMEMTTESFRRILENTSPDYEDKNEGVESADDAEAFLQLQRITELTSQAKNSPSIFKTMSSPSRKVPNYFTISTDDPILPIEAFFPKLNRNDKHDH